MSRRDSDKPERCELCGREQPLTFHHLIPRRYHRRGMFRRRFEVQRFVEWIRKKR